MAGPSASLASRAARLQPARPRRAARTDGGSDGEGPPVAASLREVREVMRGLELLKGAMQAMEAAVGGLQASLEAMVDAKLHHFKEEVLPSYRDALFAHVDRRLEAMAEAFTNQLARPAEATERLDRAARDANLVVHGLAEDAREDPAATAAGLFRDELGPPAPVLDARRLGAPDAPGRPRPRPRPLLVQSQSVTAKHAALKRSKVLRARRVFLDVDMTPAQQAARTALEPLFREAKARGDRPFWRAARLFVHTGERVQEVFGTARPPRGAPPRGRGAPPGAVPAPVATGPPVPGPAMPPPDNAPMPPATGPGPGSRAVA